MDPEKIKRDLDQAEEHIRTGETEIAKQRRIVEALEADGHDARMARTLLQTFKVLQETHIAGRNTIAGELAYAERENRGMPDDKTKTGRPDRDRINTSESYEVRDWAKRLGVSEGELLAAVRKAGPMAKDVAKALGRSL
jgi:hypothetical protein